MAKNDKRYNDMPVEELTEVAAFEEVKARLEAFKTANPNFFNYLNELTEEYNNKLEAADKAVRGKKASCGDFHMYQQVVNYDANKLYETVGPERFATVGGYEQTVVERKYDKARVEAAIKAKAFTDQELEGFRTETPRYHAPKKIDLA